MRNKKGSWRQFVWYTNNRRKCIAKKKHNVENRIVSISQPYIRPIVRGKAKNKTEFGAKISISVIDGYSYLDRVQFDSYNESEDLWSQIEAYKLRTGHYPEAVLADQIYRTKENPRKCAELEIRLSKTWTKTRKPRESGEKNRENGFQKAECC